MKTTVKAYNEDSDTFLVQDEAGNQLSIDAQVLRLSDYVRAEEPVDLVNRTFKATLFIED